MLREQALLCDREGGQQQGLLPSCQHPVCWLRSLRAGTPPSRAETPNPAAVPQPPVSRPSKGHRYPRQSCTPNISLQRKSCEHTLSQHRQLSPTVQVQALGCQHQD